MSFIVIADTREYRSDVIKYIKEAGCQVLEKQLDVGDYVAGLFVFERKSSHDFITSIVDNRLFDQLSRLKTSGLRPVVLIEGDLWRALSQRAVHPNAVLGAQLAILRMGVGIIYTQTQEQSGNAICLAAKQSEKEGRGVRLPRSKEADLNSIRIQLLTSLPGVGVKTAEELLKRYGTPLRALQNYKYWPLSTKALLKIKRILEGDQDEEGGGLLSFI